VFVEVTFLMRAAIVAPSSHTLLQPRGLDGIALIVAIHRKRRLEDWCQVSCSV
jgi:hypothetical protein